VSVVTEYIFPQKFPVNFRFAWHKSRRRFMYHALINPITITINDDREISPAERRKTHRSRCIIESKCFYVCFFTAIVLTHNNVYAVCCLRVLCNWTQTDVVACQRSSDPLSDLLNKSVTHKHPFNGPFSRTTQVSRYQKGKTNLDFTKARDSEWQWHQLGHMQVCTLLQTYNHTSTPLLCFLQAECHSCRPTNSVKALKAK